MCREEWRIIMSFIACTCDCVYQKDGYCCLERAASVDTSRARNKACINYIQRSNTKKAGKYFLYF